MTILIQPRASDHSRTLGAVSFEGAPFELDRELARAFEAWRSWRQRLKQDPSADEAPLERYHSVTSREIFRRVGELPDSEPLREPLRRWLYRLIEQRVNHAALTVSARARYFERHPLHTLKGALSPSEMLERALGDTARREPWLEAFFEHAPLLSSHAVTLWQRRAEIARRLGLESPRAIEGAVDDAEPAAQQVALRLRDRLAEHGVRAPVAWLEAALGEDVKAAWPARLSATRLLDYFRDGQLMRGLELRARPLPRVVGAASFLRGLSSLGAAWFEAQAPKDQPFVIARDPYRLEEHTAAFLFALLPLNPAFLQQRLDVGRDALGDVQRRLAQIWALELALMAFRLRLRRPALESEARLREAFQEQGEGLGLRLPPNAAGAWVRLRIEDEQRFLGLLLAPAHAERLITAHDEDWFRNPRAIDQLRAEARLPPRTRIERSELDAALALTLKRIDVLWT